MSKYQESLDRLATIRLDLIEDGETKLKQSIYGIHDNADLEITGDLSTLRELVDKETPMIVEGHKGDILFTCPKCKEVIFLDEAEISSVNYCPVCGQHLDWSDKK